MTYKITFATAIKTGQSIYKPYKARLPHFERVLNFAMKMIIDQQLIDFKDGITIHVKPMALSSRGVHYDTKNTIHLNCKFQLRTIVQVLLHELKHSEQHKQGRLSYKYDANKRDVMDYWNGVAVASASKKLSYKKYLDLPWEVEAREAEKHVDAICDAYLEAYGVKALTF